MTFDQLIENLSNNENWKSLFKEKEEKGKGKKQCPRSQCGTYLNVRENTCDCGYNFNIIEKETRTTKPILTPEILYRIVETYENRENPIVTRTEEEIIEFQRQYDLIFGKLGKITIDDYQYSDEITITNIDVIYYFESLGIYVKIMVFEDSENHIIYPKNWKEAKQVFQTWKEVIKWEVVEQDYENEIEDDDELNKTDADIALRGSPCKQITEYLSDNEIPISGFYWAVKWNLNLNEIFKKDLTNVIGSVKIIYEGFLDQENRRYVDGNERRLYLCVIFYFEKHNTYLIMELGKTSQHDHDIKFDTDCWFYGINEVKISKEIIKTYKELSEMASGKELLEEAKKFKELFPEITFDGAIENITNERNEK